MQCWTQYWMDFLKHAQHAYDKTFKYPWRGRPRGSGGVGGKPFKVTSEGIALWTLQKSEGKW